MSLTQINKAGLDELALDHVFTIGASGTDHYTFQGEGLNGTVNDPTLYLTRGKTYRFENGTGSHPIRIQSTSGASGTAYNTGVTNNAGSGTVIVEVQHDAPDVLYYQCTSHANMNGILYITGALADGGVTVDKLATGAVTNPKLASSAVGAGNLQTNAVETAKIQDNAVTTAKIADEAVTLAKLPHGDGSNDGKFLRANNGADPTFETVTGTTINNNADNRVITGSGTANTLNGESNLTYNATKLTITGSNEADLLQLGTGNSSGNTFAGIRGDNEAGIRIRGGGSERGGEIDLGGGTRNTDPATIKFSTNTSTSFQERMRIDSSGKLSTGGETSPDVISGGLCLNTGNADGIFLSCKNSDIAHGRTANDETDTLFSVRKISAANGGAEIRAYTDTAGTDPAITIFGTINSASDANSCPVIIKGARAASGSGVGTGGIPADRGVVRISNDGDNTVATFTGEGLCFHSDTAAANALDDYEEGSFSPSWQMTQNSPSITYYDQQGQYTKIGRTVHFQIYLRVNVVNANGSGILYVSGLPYNAVSNTGQGPAFGCLSFGYMDTVQGMNSERSPHAYVEANDSKIYFYTFPDGSGHAINMTVANNITNNTKIMMSGSYQTS